MLLYKKNKYGWVATDDDLDAPTINRKEIQELIHKRKFLVTLAEESRPDVPDTLGVSDRVNFYTMVVCLSTDEENPLALSAVESVQATLQS